MSKDYEQERPDAHRVSHFVSFCVERFARAHGLRPGEAVEELLRNDVLGFLVDCYAAEHTLSEGEMLDDMDIMTGRAQEDEYGVVSR